MRMFPVDPRNGGMPVRQYIRRVVLLVLSGSCAAFLAIGAGGWGLSTVLALVSAEPPNRIPHVLEIPARNWSSDPLAAPLLRNTSRIARELSKTFENDLVRPLRSLARLTDEVLGDVRAVALFIGEHNRMLDKPTVAREAAAFVKYTFKYDLPLDIALAVGFTESHFIPSSRSDYGAAGVMQVSWKVHSTLLAANGITSEADLFDPDKGIGAGCLLLSRYLRAYETTQAALGRYYGGSPEVYWARVSRNLNKFRTFTSDRDL